MADYLQPPIIFPRNIPYSWMVPLVYSAVRDYIDHCYRFSDHIFLACTDLEDSVTRATNALFSDSLSVALLHAIRKAESNLLRLIQLSVNVDELESACFHLEAYIQGLVNTKEDVMTRAKEDGGNIDEVVKGAPTTSGGLQRTRLHGHALFKDIRAQAESQIYANINARVDEFLGLASYEGILLTTSTGGMTDSAGDQTATILETATLGGPAAAGSRARAGNPLKPVVPSEYIVDMMAWLATTFRAFTNLPVKVAQTACLTACKHIASSLQNQILGPNVKAVSESALRQISSDLAECESFARSKPVPDVDTSMLILIFADLRMLIDLVLLDDWAVFLTGYSNSRGSMRWLLRLVAGASYFRRLLGSAVSVKPY
ncbi:unnamed protein product [Protopolystoma xenopodis]|uniref:Exocyst complex subunit EXOC6/Sec15 C-terminal domain-containing protein n=1 Tax=Protopolystoma xenopodis TaxID=117903 RepID=A0A3S5CH66_9PLAT|nr:unnamed protein product [Protopolystoma xenopodis]